MLSGEAKLFMEFKYGHGGRGSEVLLRNSTVCASSMYIKMLYFLFVRAWSMPRISLYLSCGVPFPVWTPDNISGLMSVFLWLLR